MPEHSLPSDIAASTDPITRWFLIVVALLGIVYAGFRMTPSSYGLALEQLGAPELGPVAGTGRGIRLDEWSMVTPSFQAAVRNRFRRVNETSFYREDLRNYIALPLADWGLIFKPQMWAFFVVSPALAMSLFYALSMCAFLAGFQLLFRELEVPAGVAVAAVLTIYFSGFCQFWWTMCGPLFAGYPWILLAVLHPMSWWKKALLCAWAFPVFVLSHAYPALLLTMAWGVVFIILAFRPSLVRSPGNMAAITVGVLSAAVVSYAYYVDVIPVMRDTFYPGRRVAAPGTVPFFVVLSQIFPFLVFQLSEFRHLIGANICEGGTVGSFLPLLTLCLTRYRDYWKRPTSRNASLILLAGFAAITLWQIAPVPSWIGHILLWDRGEPQRWLFISGLLLTLAALPVWSGGLISIHPIRLALFLAIGPLASLLVKIALLVQSGMPAGAAINQCFPDILLFVGAVVAVHVAWTLPAATRVSTIVFALALLNVYAFGRFNPLQSADPLFQVPDTPVVRQLRTTAGASPDGILADPGFFGSGSVLNGLGFRSVTHVLIAPKLDLLRSYFPAMDKDEFNRIFNRFAHIEVTQDPLPALIYQLYAGVPMEVFVPVRNLRRVTFGPPRREVCVQPADGAISQVLAQGNQLTIEGWARWNKETQEQGIRILSARPLRTESLATIIRPDIAEQVRDYNFVKSGFNLRISSADGKPIQPAELALAAFGTSVGEKRLGCCACP